MIYYLKPNQKIVYPEITINVTSRSKTWGRNLSPFLLKAGFLYNDKETGECYFSENVENAWQFSKVYLQHTENNEPTYEYWKWAKNGWSDKWGHRYPMGKGAIPEYSYWENKKLGYIQARKNIYIYLYKRAAEKTTEYEFLKYMYKKEGQLYLIDFDVYNHRKLGMSYDDVINNPNRKMGHAFVIGMMLENYL